MPIAGSKADLNVSSVTDTQIRVEIKAKMDNIIHLVDALFNLNFEPTDEQFPNINAALGLTGNAGVLSVSSSGSITIDGRDSYSGLGATHMHLHGISVLNDNSSPSITDLKEEFNVAIEGADPVVSVNNSEVPLPATSADHIKEHADRVLEGGSGTEYKDFDDLWYSWGTEEDPEVTFIDGNARFKSGVSGAGILFINGNLRISNEIYFNGIVIVGGSLIDFTGEGLILWIKGALLAGTEDGGNVEVGNREINIVYDSNLIEKAKDLVKLPEKIELVSWWEDTQLLSEK